MEDGSILAAVSVSIRIAPMRPFDKMESLLTSAEQALAIARQRGLNAIVGGPALDS